MRANRSAAARLARRAGEEGDALAHLERIAGARAEHLVHVGDQRARRQSGARRHLDEALGQCLRLGI